MPSTKIKCLTLALACLVLPGSASATTADRNPIRYAVEDNNRLFVGGDDARYVNDLHLYLQCVARVGANYIGDGPDCAQYRDRGRRVPVEVPDLRTGELAEEYRVQYDKALLAHPKGYATGGLRRVRFDVDEAWRRSSGKQLTGCRWFFATKAGEVEVPASDCGPVLRDVHLALSSDAKEFSWRADVRLVAELAGGSKITFDKTAVVRDFLIVAMGDSFTSGEGNPERNYSWPMPAQWLDYRCHRSVFSYPVMVATLLALADPRHSVTIVDVACSGAQTTAGILETYRGIIDAAEAKTLWNPRWRFGRPLPVPASWKRYGTEVVTLPAQVEQVSSLLRQPGPGARRKPDLLLMSIGVNDVGFGKLVYRLATEDCTAACSAELMRWRNQDAAPCSDPSDNASLRRSFECLGQRLKTMREAIDKHIAPQRAYLMEYIDPLRDEKNRLCSDEPQHQKRLLDGVLGSLQGVVGLVRPIGLTREEFAFADAEFYLPLKTELDRTAAAPGWALPPLVKAHESKGRGFCASPSWYHTFKESKYREHTRPGRPFDSMGTLHPNGFGHYYAALRVLTQLRSEANSFSVHNIKLMDGADFDPKAANARRADRSDGFAFYLQDMGEPNQRLENYYKF